MPYIPVNQLKEWRKNNQPKSCPILDRETNDWVVDHDHKSGEIRAVISRQGNTLIGKIENIFTSLCKGKAKDLPKVLENISKYLRKDSTKILHPVGLNQLTSRFKNYLLKGDQKKLLKLLGAKDEDIDNCNNQTARVKMFRNLLKQYYDQRNTTKNSERTESTERANKQIRRILLQISRGYTRGSKASIS